MTFNGADREEGEALLRRGLRRARDPKARAFSLCALLFSGDDEAEGDGRCVGLFRFGVVGAEEGGVGGVK
jgi:hypothetical protein